MARYIDPVCKLCRREGQKLFLKGDRCFSPKCGVERRGYPPGMHGSRGQFRRKESDYALQLREKQRAKRIYGVLERQFRRYFQEALRSKGLTGATLLVILERRLDNVVFRLGLADSRAQARQLVLHGHFQVNSRKANIPSLLVKAGDTISVSERARKTVYFKELAQVAGDRAVPEWLSFDAAGLTARVAALPTRDQVDVSLNEQLIVEHYSR